DIQSITITSTQTVPQPKPHTTYTIQITTPTRTWTVSRRYNDFVALHTELISSTGKPPPATLPAKHPWSLTRSAYDEKIIHERKVLLEAYLRAILNHRDPRWRQAYTWNDFLSVPTASSSRSNPNASSSTSAAAAAGVQGAPDHFTASNWLAEHSAVQTLLRLTRSALLKRDALAGMGDAAGSRGASVEAKKLLREVGERVDGLEKGLGETSKSLGEGEKARREELVEAVRSERGNLQRMAEAGVRTSGFNRDTTSNTTTSMPGAYGSNSPVSQGRVFGSAPRPAPQETEQTRPLEDRGLLQLQHAQVETQDGQLTELSRLLQKQRRMGEEIAQEIGEQNELLDDVDRGVDRVGGKLARTKRQMNKL
ncbi:Phox homologous domain-containing protein, partial [Naematelia encephala]